MALQLGDRPENILGGFLGAPKAGGPWLLRRMDIEELPLLSCR